MWALWSGAAWAFCGTFVGPANDIPVNVASRVVVVQNPTHTVVTMTPDASATDNDFGLLMPIPRGVDLADIEVLEDVSVLDTLDALTAPRVVSYTCETAKNAGMVTGGGADGGCNGGVAAGGGGGSSGCAAATEVLNVIEDPFGAVLGAVVDQVNVLQIATKGDYQFALVRAQEAGALWSWLDLAGFQLAPGAEPMVQEYLDQGVNFLAARVRTDPREAAPWLQPIQVRYPERTYTLPLQLGTANANGDQEVMLWVIGDQGDGLAQILTFPEVEQESDCMLQPDMSGSDTMLRAFDEARGDKPGVAVLEYGWDFSTTIDTSAKCDPCPTVDDFPDVRGPIAALGKENPDSAFVSRFRLQYDPLELDSDLHFPFTRITENRQIVYIEHLDELEDTFPLCFEGFPENPRGRCDDTEGASFPWWTLLGLPLLGWPLRRR